MQTDNTPLNFFRNLSLRAKLIATFLLVALIPIILLSVFNIRASREALTNAAQTTLYAAASQTATSIDSFITLNKQIVAQESELEIFADYLRATNDRQVTEDLEATVNNTLISLKNKDPNYSFLESYSLIDINGIVVADTFRSNIGTDYRDRQFYQLGISDFRPHVSHIQFSRQTNQANIFFSARIHNAVDGTLGLLVARHNAVAIQQLAANERGLAGSRSFPVIFDENFLYLAHGNDSTVLYDIATDTLSASRIAQLKTDYRLPNNVDTQPFTDLVDNLDNNRTFFVSRDPSTDDETNQVAVTRIDDINWYITFFQPESVFLQTVSQQTQNSIILSLIITIVVFFFAIIAAQILSTPILRLITVAERVANNDLTARANINRQDEIGKLGRAFNAMTEQLAHLVEGLEQRVQYRTEDLEQRVEQLRVLNTTARSINSVLNPDILLPHIAEMTRVTFDYYAIAVFLVNKEKKEVYLAAANLAEGNNIDWTKNPIRLQIGAEGFVGHTAATGEVLMIPDVTKDARYHYDDRLPHTRSELCLPLKIQDDVLGVLNIQSNQLNAFNREAVEVLRILSDQLAIAIRNADLYQSARAAKREAEEANQMKTQFLTNMSHELRTPLNSIINFSYLLTLGTEGELNTGQDEMVNRIGDAGRHLLNLINDILDLAKIESGQMELFFEEVDVLELVDRAMSTASVLIKDKDVILNKDIPYDIPKVMGDRTRIGQVLLNLISNAAKFTDEGSITVAAEGDDEWVTIHVIDTGMGISTRDQTRVFQEFVQVDGTLTRQKGGTGLGLPISRQFIQLHGGEMWLTSELGQGSTFSFRLPSIPASTNNDSAPILPEEIKVLVIDDDPTVRQTISQQLQDSYKVIKVNDSRQAVEAVRQNKPDAVIVDIMMPHMDGWDVIRALKDDENTNNVPIIVCSFINERKQAFVLDVDDYLVKPVNPDDLKKTVNRLAQTGGKIIAVDDDPNALDIIYRMLDGMSYQVITADDGLDGLNSIETQLPDVIVLDLMMPNMSGFEVLTKIRNNPKTAHLPVVVLTAKDLTSEEMTYLQKEANALLQKGKYPAEELTATINRAISRNRD
ncbi:MAG TPA: response regulator [Anaerolineae bacterium]|nr:response regulator [Anaerolineae bacterium]